MKNLRNLTVVLLLLAAGGSSLSAQSQDVGRHERLSLSPVQPGFQYSLIVDELMDWGIQGGGQFTASYRLDKTLALGITTGLSYQICYHIPVVAQLNVYFMGDRRVNPLFYFSLGMDIAFRKASYTNYPSPDPNYNWVEGSRHIAGVGLASGVGLGVNVRLTSRWNIFLLHHVRLGASVRMERQPNTWDYYKETNPLFMWGTQLGVTYNAPLRANR